MWRSGGRIAVSQAIVEGGERGGGWDCNPWGRVPGGLRPPDVSVGHPPGGVEPFTPIITNKNTETYLAVAGSDVPRRNSREELPEIGVSQPPAGGKLPFLGNNAFSAAKHAIPFRKWNVALFSPYFAPQFGTYAGFGPLARVSIPMFRLQAALAGRSLFS